MKKIIRLTEDDLARIVKRVIQENEGPFNIGHADYQKNWDKFNDEMEQESKDRKYHIPNYDTRSGRSWTNKGLREYVYEKFGARLPKNFSLEYTEDISEWLKNNGY